MNEQERLNATNKTSATTPSSSQSLSMHQSSQARIGQLFDEEDHRRCSSGNQRALLAESLENLRGLVMTLKKEDWKYASSSTHPGDVDYSASAR